MSSPETTTLPLVRSTPETDLEPRYRILIHNDEVTTFDYVVGILGTLFMLSFELAEHIAFLAHDEGAAVVLIRPRTEADKLTKVANGRARADGFPLAFSMEPEDE